MHIDWQQISALAIVAVAALAVGRRLWGQIGAFRSKPGRTSPGSGCEGCPSSGTQKSANTKNAKPNPVPLMQIQTRPPLHLRRPPQ